MSTPAEPPEPISYEIEIMADYPGRIVLVEAHGDPEHPDYERGVYIRLKIGGSDSVSAWEIDSAWTWLSEENAREIAQALLILAGSGEGDAQQRGGARRASCVPRRRRRGYSS
ncbi:hypothetical protein [Candidatus Solirubrobacter pratensis]|uniref:hypothetical protein n=1 Tax=Candidatus Solirubrobacter pratensis TaxID=1298857 RepID=UPI0003FA0401|nr:hypothetical protein [Candidatus Solirubrobacter pratensis]